MGKFEEMMKIASGGTGGGTAASGSQSAQSGQGSSKFERMMAVASGKPTKAAAFTLPTANVQRNPLEEARRRLAQNEEAYEAAKQDVGISGIWNRLNGGSPENRAKRETAARLAGLGTQDNSLAARWQDFLDDWNREKEAAKERRETVRDTYKALEESREEVSALEDQARWQGALQSVFGVEPLLTAGARMDSSLARALGNTERAEKLDADRAFYERKGEEERQRARQAEVLEAWEKEHGAGEAGYQAAGERARSARETYENARSGRRLDETGDTIYQQEMEEARSLYDGMGLDEETLSGLLAAEQEEAWKRYENRVANGYSPAVYADEDAMRGYVDALQEAEWVRDWATAHRYDDVPQRADFTLMADAGEELFRGYKAGDYVSAEDENRYNEAWQEYYDQAVESGMDEEDARRHADAMAEDIAREYGYNLANSSRFDPRYHTEFMEPDERWSDEEKRTFYALLAYGKAAADRETARTAEGVGPYGEEAEGDPSTALRSAQDDTRGNEKQTGGRSDDWMAAAREYGAELNKQYNAAEVVEKARDWTEYATRNLGTGLVSTVRSVGAHIAGGLPDFLRMAAEQGYRGDLYETQHEGISRWADVSTGAIAQELNEKSGTVDERVPLLGGKGVGDVYSLFVSMAESAASIGAGELLLGGAGLGGALPWSGDALAAAGEAVSLPAFFGMAASSATRDALERGRDGQHAVWTGLASGLAEVLGEKFSVENLLSNNGLKDFLTKGAFRELLKQGGIEASEEVFTTLLNSFSDRLLNGGESELRAEVLVNQYNGMTQREAERAAIKDYFKRLADDALGGFLSGSIMSGGRYAGYALPAAATTYGAGETGEQGASGGRIATASVSTGLAMTEEETERATTQGRPNGEETTAENGGKEQAREAAQTLFDAAAATDEGSQAREAAERYRAGFEKRGSISNLSAARLTAAIEDSLQNAGESVREGVRKILEAGGAFGQTEEAEPVVDEESGRAVKADAETAVLEDGSTGRVLGAAYDPESGELLLRVETGETAGDSERDDGRQVAAPTESDTVPSGRGKPLPYGETGETGRTRPWAGVGPYERDAGMETAGTSSGPAGHLPRARGRQAAVGAGERLVPVSRAEISEGLSKILDTLRSVLGPEQAAPAYNLMEKGQSVGAYAKAYGLVRNVFGWNGANREKARASSLAAGLTDGQFEAAYLHGQEMARRILNGAQRRTAEGETAQVAENETAARTDGGEARYSLRTAMKDGFDALIGRFYKKNLSPNDPVYIGPVENSDVSFGSSAPFIITASDLNKSTRQPKGSRSAHAMDERFVRTLPQRMAEPVLTYRSTRNGKRSFTYVLYNEYTNALTAVGGELDSQYEGQTVNRILTMFDISSPEQFLTQEGKTDFHTNNKERAQVLLEKAQVQDPARQKILDSLDETRVQFPTLQRTYGSLADTVPQTPGKSKTQSTELVSFGGATVDGVKYAAVTERVDRADVKAVRSFAEAAGIRVVFFQSEADAQGRYRGGNGFYKDGTVYLDIHAGQNRQGESLARRTLLFTMSHEVTHLIQENAPAQYAKLRRFVTEYLLEHEGERFQDLVEQKQARDPRGNLSYDAAVDEVVADACERVLVNSEAVQEMARTRPKLYETVRRYVKRFLERMARHEEARAMEPVLNELRAIWDEGLRKAVGVRGNETEVRENETGGERIVPSRAGPTASERTGLAMTEKNEDGSTKYQARDRRGNVVANEEVNRERLRRTLQEIYEGKHRKHGFTFPVLRHTPQVFMEYCHLDGDRSFVMTSDKAYKAMQSNSEGQHALGVDGLMEVIEKLPQPDYIVRQNFGNNAGHHVAILTIGDGETVAAVDLGNYRNAKDSVNEEAGVYNVLITAFRADSAYIDESIFDERNDVVYDREAEEKNEASEHVALSDSLSGLARETSSDSSIRDSGQNSNTKFSERDLSATDRELLLEEAKKKDASAALKAYAKEVRRAEKLEAKGEELEEQLNAAQERAGKQPTVEEALRRAEESAKAYNEAEESLRKAKAAYTPEREQDALYGEKYALALKAEKDKAQRRRDRAAEKDRANWAALGRARQAAKERTETEKKLRKNTEELDLVRERLAVMEAGKPLQDAAEAARERWWSKDVAEGLRQNRALREANRRLQRTLDWYREQARMTEPEKRKVRRDDIEALAKALLNEHGSEVDRAWLEERLQAIGDYLVSGDGLNAGELNRSAKQIAEELLKNARLAGYTDEYTRLVRDEILDALMSGQVREADTQLERAAKRAVTQARAERDEAREQLRQERATREEQVRRRVERMRERQEASRERQQTIESIRRTQKRLNRFLTENSAKRHIPEGMKADLGRFLTTLNTLGPFASEERSRDYLDEMDALRQIVQGQGRWLDGEGADEGWEGLLLDLPEDLAQAMQAHINRVKEKARADRTWNISKMDLRELRELDETLTILSTAVTNANILLTDPGSFREIGKLGGQGIRDLGAIRERRSVSRLRNSVSRHILWANTTPYYFFKRLGTAGEALFKSLTKGWGKLAMNARQIQLFAATVYSAKEVKAWEKATHTFELRVRLADQSAEKDDGGRSRGTGETGDPSTPLRSAQDDTRRETERAAEGVGPYGEGTERDRSDAERIRESYNDRSGLETVTMTEAQMMNLWCLMRRGQAQGHILGAGIKIEEFQNGRFRLSRDAKTYLVTIEDLDAMFDTLSDRQKEVCRALQKYMNTVGSDWGNEISLKRYGIRAFTEENYWPIRTDSNSRDARTPDADRANLFRLLNQSFTKSTVRNANNAIVVGSVFDDFANHMADMAKYNALALPMLDAMRWFNYRERGESNENGQYTSRSVREAMESAWGREALDYFMTLMQDLNGSSEGGRGDSFLQQVAGANKVASVGANLRVALQQPTSIVRASLLLDGRYLARGAAMKDGTGKALKWSGLANWKDMGYFDVNINRGLREQIKHADNWKETLVEKSMILAEKGDKLTWGALWNACELETREKHRELKGEELMQKTAERFDEVIMATQVMDSTLTRSQNMRGKGLMSEFTAFMAEPTLTFNTLMDVGFMIDAETRRTDARTAARKYAPAALKAGMTFVLSGAVTAIAQALGDLLRDDDEYAKWYQTFWDNYKTDFLDNLDPTQLIPVVKDLTNILLRGERKDMMSTLTAQKLYEAAAIWTETAKLAGGTLDKATATTWYGNMTTYGKVYKSLEAVSRLAGLPASAAMRDMVSIWNRTAGELNRELKLKTYDPGEEREIQYAVKDGYLTADEAEALLIERGLASEKEAARTVYVWSQDGGAYDAVKAAALAGDRAAFREASDAMTAAGYREREIRSAVRTAIKDRYQGTDTSGGKLSKAEAITLVQTYGGMTRQDAEKTVQEWTCFVVTGIGYDKIKDELLDGAISRTRAAELWRSYGGYSQEDASDKAGFALYQDEHPNTTLSQATWKGWTERVKPSGVSGESYAKLRKSADADGNGSITQAEAAAALDAEVQAGRLTTKQAEAVWSGFGSTWKTSWSGYKRK